jgi:hypothetical protein
MNYGGYRGKQCVRLGIRAVITVLYSGYRCGAVVDYAKKSVIVSIKSRSSTVRI